MKERQHLFKYFFVYTDQLQGKLCLKILCWKTFSKYKKMRPEFKFYLTIGKEKTVYPVLKEENVINLVNANLHFSFQLRKKN